MQSLSRNTINTQSIPYMLSLTEYVRLFKNDALWDARACPTSIPGLLYLSQSQTNLKQKEKLVFDKLYTGSHTA